MQRSRSFQNIMVRWAHQGCISITRSQCVPPHPIFGLVQDGLGIRCGWTDRISACSRQLWPGFSFEKACSGCSQSNRNTSSEDFTVVFFSDLKRSLSSASISWRMIFPIKAGASPCCVGSTGYLYSMNDCCSSFSHAVDSVQAMIEHLPHSSIIVFLIEKTPELLPVLSARPPLATQICHRKVLGLKRLSDRKARICLGIMCAR